jgi:APA family basic amino acid/polyamine antiporter
MEQELKTTTKGDGAPTRRLTLLDTTSIIVGIIIGSTIFKMSPTISYSAGVHTTATLQHWLQWPAVGDVNGLFWSHVIGIVAIWVLGGVIALVGALCYAELATALPQEGGNYVFLTKAFGRSTGLAFAWVEFWIVRPGNIGAIAFVAATFALPLLPMSLKETLAGRQEAVLAVVFIAGLTAINLLGIQMERWTQNALTAAKVLGLLFVATLALVWMSPVSAPSADVAKDVAQGTFLAPWWLAFVFVMFAYGGWSDMPYVAAEVANPRRNLTRALLFGTGSVLAIYLFLMLACVSGLGLKSLYESGNIASAVMQRTFGEWGNRAISGLVVISCLGAIHGMLFTGARVFYKLGSDHPLFGWLGKWQTRGEVPARSLLVQAAVTIALVVLFGANQEAFERMVIFTGPFYWGFICLVVFGLIVLRDRNELSADRYRVPLYPLPPVLFCGACLWMAYSGIDYAFEKRPWEGLWALGVIVSGVALVAIDARLLRSSRAERTD